MGADSEEIPILPNLADPTVARVGTMTIEGFKPWANVAGEVEVNPSNEFTVGIEDGGSVMWGITM